LDATVAVCLQRTPALVVALLGILFAGGDGVGFLGWEVVTSYIYLYMFIIVIILFPI
jgi:hypothetical protein